VERVWGNSQKYDKGGVQVKKTAIAIMSFNRPEYLEQVLDSIAKQKDGDKYDYYAFQDGAINKFSGERYADDDQIEQCKKAISGIMPEGIIFSWVNNLSVYLNFRVAEKMLFERLGYERIIFCEDDLVLQPYYFCMLSKLMDKLERYPVAEVCLCGDITKTVKEQAELENVLMPAGHHWGYGLYRDKWIERQKYMDEYDVLVGGIDYRKRPTKEIQEMYRKYGATINASSQDGAKDVAYMRAGLGRLTTTTVHAKYIGANGLHMKSSLYDSLGFSDTEIYHEHDVVVDSANVIDAIERSINKTRGM